MNYIRSLIGCAALFIFSLSNLTSQAFVVDYHVNEPEGTELTDLLPDLPMEIDSAVATDLQDTLLVMVQNLGYLISSMDSMMVKETD